jgi:hypothetical protein
MTDGTILGPVTATDPELAKALEERTELWAQAVRAKALEREVQDGLALLHKRETSRSWRVTAPLRRLRARLQALLPRR